MNSKHLKTSQILIAWISRFRIYLSLRISIMTKMDLDVAQRLVIIKATIELMDFSGGLGLSKIDHVEEGDVKTVP